MSTDLPELAQQHREVLKLSAFITARAVTGLFEDEDGLREAERLLRAAGVSKVYLDVYRAHKPSPDVLARARDFFRAAGFEASAGITTIAGPDFGKPSSGGWYWLCYTNRKTRDDLAQTMADAARLFDEIIVDDFLCTTCRCEECDSARGDRSWERYRLDLMVEIARTCLLEPAHSANPNCRVINKYPQWYDRFHCFGYDVISHPHAFDLTWAGTETRDPEKKHVRQYQAYVNWTWIKSIAGERLLGAWFDQLDCYPEVYVEQAFQSVLAGAPEITLFHYTPQDFGPDNDNMNCLKEHLPLLFRLAQMIKGKKRLGIHAYKPLESDPGDEAFIFDYLGMFGLPLVMTHEFPLPPRGQRPQAPLILTRHAAHDPQAADKAVRFIESGGTALLTAGFLASQASKRKLVALAGYGARPVRPIAEFTYRFLLGDKEFDSEAHVEIGAALNPRDAQVIASAILGGQNAPILTSRQTAAGGRVIAMSAKSFAFWPDSPRVTIPQPVSLISLPPEIANWVRAALLEPLGLGVGSERTKLGVYPFDSDLLVLQNFDQRPTEVRLAFKPDFFGPLPGYVRDEASGQQLPSRENRASVRIPPRSVAILRLAP